MNTFAQGAPSLLYHILSDRTFGIQVNNYRHKPNIFNSKATSIRLKAPLKNETVGNETKNMRSLFCFHFIENYQMKRIKSRGYSQKRVGDRARKFKKMRHEAFEKDTYRIALH